MKRDKKHPLVHRPGTEISIGGGRRTSPVIARMTRDVLAQAQAKELSAARFRIGEYELREPDYRQIRRWAEALAMSPAEVLEILAQSWVGAVGCGGDFGSIGLHIEDAAISWLAWDLEALPLIPDAWEMGLLIHVLGIGGKWPDARASLQPRLPQLDMLHCDDIRVASLDLAGVPQLTELFCSGNKLTELDLSPMPGLECFHCSQNELTELDLSPVPRLTELWCRNNQLTELDLSPVPGLGGLDCCDNQLTELDLSPVPRLIYLECDEDVRILNLPPGLEINSVKTPLVTDDSDDDIPF